MKFQTLEVENFCSIEAMSLDLADRGLVLILGENKDSDKADSNGSGKSLIIDALVWCLWGKTVRGVKGDDVVSNASKKNCSVSLTFTEGDSSFVVTRFQKHKEHKKEFRRENDLVLEVDGEDKTGKSITDTQEKVDQILGMSRDTFCALMPGAGIQIASLTDKAIKELVEQLLQMTELSEAQALARKRLKEVDLKLSVLTSAHAEKQLMLEAMVNEYNEVEQFSKDFDKDKEERIAKLREKIVNVLHQKAKVEEKQEAVRESIRKLTQEKDTYSVVSGLDAAKAAEQAREALETGKKEHTLAINLLYREIHDPTLRLDKYKKLGLGECSHCGQEVSQDHLDSVMSLLTEQVEEVQERIDHANERWDKSRESLELQVKETREEVERQLELLDMHRRIVEKMRELEHKDKDASKTLDEVEAYIEELNGEIEEEKAKPNKFVSILTAKEKKLQDFREEIAAGDEEKADLEKQVSDLAFWVEGFSPKGIRSYLLSQVTPIMNKKVAQYSQVLTDGDMDIQFNTVTELKNGNTKEDFHIDVHLKNGASSYKGLSQGEKARADLAIALTLGDLATLRTDRHVPFRFIDEAFERVDASGLDAIVDLLHAQAEKYETIFVISHKSELKDYFTQSMTVTKDRGISRLL